MNTQTNAMTEAQQRAYDQAQVMLAFSQGKKIQCKLRNADYIDWENCLSVPLWDFHKFDYRIAPEPQEVWLWVKKGEISVNGEFYPGTEKELSERGYTKKLFREVLNA